jgi:hypothetical protein
MGPDRSDIDKALRRLHTPETFGRAVLDAALRSAASGDEFEFEAKVVVSAADEDGSIPICFFLLHHEICISIPVV